MSAVGKKAEMIGKKFGMLTCLRELGKRPPCRDTWFEFQCECGNLKEIRGSNVRNSGVVSCGCYRIKMRSSKEQCERVSEAQRQKAIDLNGAQMGLLTYVGEDCYKSSRDGGKNHRYIKVRCACGVIKSLACHSFLSGNIYSCGCQKNKLSAHRLSVIAKTLPRDKMGRTRGIDEPV